MKNKRTFLIVLFLFIIPLFYRHDSVAAMAAEQHAESAAQTATVSGNASAGVQATVPGDEPAGAPDAVPGDEPVGAPDAVPGGEPGDAQEAVPGGASAGAQDAVPGDASAGAQDAVPGDEPVGVQETVPGDASAGAQDAVPGDEPAPDAATVSGNETAGVPDAESDEKPAAGAASGSEESVSTGTELIAWLESHKNTGGTVKLADHVVLDGAYSFYPDWTNMPDIFVDADQYTITAAGEIEISGDHHLTFSGRPDGKGIFYVAENGVLSMDGVAVESGNCALWQEEGAGLHISECHISGDVHYADTPFVMYYKDYICAVVEKGETINDALPAQMCCTVNRRGQLKHDEWMPVSWHLEGTEKQQEQRRRFKVQGSFVGAASAGPVPCTVVYNDYPLTFTDVQASARGCLYTFHGGYTVAEEDLPFTVMAEYSFDGENWSLYEEQRATSAEPGFYIACKREQDETAAQLKIYIRLQRNDGETRCFSNVLCYEADNLDSEEDIGGSRGGGTSIINPPDKPQESAGEATARDESGSDTDGGNDSGSMNQEGPAGMDQTHGGSDGSDRTTADGGVENAAPSDGDVSGSHAPQMPRELSDNGAGLASDTEPSNHNGEQPQNMDARQPLRGELKPDHSEGMNPGDSGAHEEKEAVSALAAYGTDGADFPRSSERIMRAENRQVDYMAIAAGAVFLSAIAGAAGFYVHSRLGTKR